MEIPRDGRRFLMADTGVMVRPKLPKKIEILREAVAVARALGADTPRVAMMAASEKVIDAMPETFDAAELERRSVAGEFPDMIIQGPALVRPRLRPDGRRQEGDRRRRSSARPTS